MRCASAVGTTIEWYDYFIYSTAAALVFGSQFFSPLNPASGTLAAFATLGVGFLARPIGGIIWGHFGDRVGRKAMLVASLVLMGVATVGVGLLPTFEQIGVLAPILLLVLRLLQGLSAGGSSCCISALRGARSTASFCATASRSLPRFGLFCMKKLR